MIEETISVRRPFFIVLLKSKMLTSERRFLDSWFLGPRMIYTSGVVNDPTRKETLEELQDNKLALVCHKLELKPTDTLLDIGCGWGTLVAYASKNFDCDSTGVTLGKNQTIFGNKRIADNGVSPDKARILCKDYREIGTQKFSKIVSLEMAEVSSSELSTTLKRKDLTRWL